MKKKYNFLILVAEGFIAHISITTILFLWVLATAWGSPGTPEIVEKLLIFLLAPVYLLAAQFLQGVLCLLSYVINSLVWGFAFAFIFTFLKRKLSKNNNPVNPV